MFVFQMIMVNTKIMGKLRMVLYCSYQYHVHDGREVHVHCKVKVKSAYEPKWPIRPELIPVSVALSY